MCATTPRSPEDGVAGSQVSGCILRLTECELLVTFQYHSWISKIVDVLPSLPSGGSVTTDFHFGMQWQFFRFSCDQEANQQDTCLRKTRSTKKGTKIYSLKPAIQLGHTLVAERLKKGCFAKNLQNFRRIDLHRVLQPPLQSETHEFQLSANKYIQMVLLASITFKTSGEMIRTTSTNVPKKLKYKCFNAFVQHFFRQLAEDCFAPRLRPPF